MTDQTPAPTPEPEPTNPEKSKKKAAWILAVLAVLVVIAIATSGDDTDTTTTPSDTSQPADAEPKAEPADEPDEPVVDEDEVFRLSLELTLDGYTAAQRLELCNGIDLLGMDDTLAFIKDGYIGGGDSVSWNDATARDVMETFYSTDC